LKGIVLKKIIFTDKKKKKDYWLDLNDITHFYVEPYYEKTQLHLKLKTDFDVYIRGSLSKEDFYKILKSENDVSVINVCDINIYEARIEFHVLDWVSQAMAIG
jgi:hypothetical protein